MSLNIKIKKQLLAKDRSCQKEIYINYFKLVMSITSRYVGYNEDAEELCNDVFLKVFSKVDQYNPDYPFEVWLRKIAINTCIDHYRKHKKQRDIKIIELKDYVIQEHQEGEADSVQPELLPLIKNLPAQYRMVFNLFIFEDYTHKEISHLLNISEGTSKSALSRAKKIIKNHLQTNNIKPRSLLNG